MIFENGDRIVFAGDSVTDMGSANPVGEGLFDNLGNGFVRSIDSLLSGVYPEVRIRVTNSGVSGNTSSDLLERWQRDVLDLQPQWINICIGINDVWRQFDSPAFGKDWVQPEQYEKNLEAMIVSAKDKVKGIFIMTPYYMEPNSQDVMRARMDVYGNICKKLAQKYGCTLIDLQQMFNSYFRFRHSASIAWDRVHPNRVGAAMIARAFLKCCDFDFEHIPVEK